MLLIHLVVQYKYYHRHLEMLREKIAQMDKPTEKEIISLPFLVHIVFVIRL